MRSRNIHAAPPEPRRRMITLSRARGGEEGREEQSVLLEIRLVETGGRSPRQASAADTGPRLLRVEDAAMILSISRAALYPMLGRELPVVRIGRMVRVPLDALERFVRERSE